MGKVKAKKLEDETIPEVMGDETVFNNKALSIKKDAKTNEFILLTVDFNSDTLELDSEMKETLRSPHIGIIIEAFKAEITKLVFHKMAI